MQDVTYASRYTETIAVAERVATLRGGSRGKHEDAVDVTNNFPSLAGDVHEVAATGRFF